MNVKEILARNRREIWSLSECNWTRADCNWTQTLNQVIVGSSPVAITGMILIGLWKAFGRIDRNILIQKVPPLEFANKVIDWIKSNKSSGGLDSLLIQGGAWQERGGGVFKGGLIPQCPLWGESGRAKNSPKWKITITSITCHISGTV